MWLDFPSAPVSLEAWGWLLILRTSPLSQFSGSLDHIDARGTVFPALGRSSHYPVRRDHHTSSGTGFGRAIALSDVPDPVFSQGMVGFGAAVEPYYGRWCRRWHRSAGGCSS